MTGEDLGCFQIHVIANAPNLFQYESIIQGCGDVF